MSKYKIGDKLLVPMTVKKAIDRSKETTYVLEFDNITSDEEINICPMLYNELHVVERFIDKYK